MIGRALAVYLACVALGVGLALLVFGALWPDAPGGVACVGGMLCGVPAICAQFPLMSALADRFLP